MPDLIPDPDKCEPGTSWKLAVAKNVTRKPLLAGRMVNLATRKRTKVAITGYSHGLKTAGGIMLTSAAPGKNAWVTTSGPAVVATGDSNV